MEQGGDFGQQKQKQQGKSVVNPFDLLYQQHRSSHFGPGIAGGRPPVSPQSMSTYSSSNVAVSSPSSGQHAGLLIQSSIPLVDSLAPMNSSLVPRSPAPLPPRHGGAHRRSQSDIPLAFVASVDSFAAGDDLVDAFMNLDALDAFNSVGSGMDDSRASGSRGGGADSSENEAESSINNDSSTSGRNKRTAGEDLGQPSRHFRSLSMDSFMMGTTNFAEELLKTPPAIDSSQEMGGAATDFSDAEKKKIMANEKLLEMALADPKRVKRILANRQSAARSKERKMRYISELEHKLQTLQAEATTLSAQLTMLQRDSSGLATQNNEMKIRLQSMEQQARLRDALNDALTAEVRRLKLIIGERRNESTRLDGSANQQTAMNAEMIQLQRLQIQPQQKDQQQPPQTEPQN